MGGNERREEEGEEGRIFFPLHPQQGLPAFTEHISILDLSAGD